MILYITHSTKNIEKSAKEESKYYKTILVLERLFRSSKESFYINNSFDSTIWYSKFEQEFEALLKTDINKVAFFISLIDLYKRVFVRAKHYQRPEHIVKVIPMNNSLRTTPLRELKVK